MPKQAGNDAESIINQTAQQKKATSAKASAPLYQTPYGYFNNALNAQPQKNIPIPTSQNILGQFQGMSPVSFQSANQPTIKNGIPFPIFTSASDYYQKMADLAYINAKFGLPEQGYNTDYYPGMMNTVDTSLLPDNFVSIYPEQTNSARPSGSDGSRDSGGGGSAESAIPFPEYTWGGGGYGNDYWRDSGLINWRI